MTPEQLAEIRQVLDALGVVPHETVRALLAEVDEQRARIDSADQAFIDMAQANGGITLAPERLPQISRIMSALRGHETPHRVAYNRVWAEVDRLQAELATMADSVTEAEIDATAAESERDEAIADRDRARDVAVALEQENARLTAERATFRKLVSRALSIRMHGESDNPTTAAGRGYQWPTWDRDADRALRADDAETDR